jgi:hypothetical protein
LKLTIKIIYLITFPLKPKNIITGINKEEKVAITAFTDKGPVIIHNPLK